MAQLRGITKKFGAVTALHSIDIEVRRGELLAVLGPNGAGKSTAISLWLGLIEADAGEVTLLGGSPQDISRRRGLGVMMQDVEMPKELKVRELVRLAASYYDDPMGVEETLKRAGIEALANRAYGKLSGGQKRQRNSRWRSAAGRRSCSSTNPRSGSTCRRARRCGPACAGCSPTVAPWC